MKLTNENAFVGAKVTYNGKQMTVIKVNAKSFYATEMTLSEFNEKYDFDGTTSIQFNSDSKYNIVTNKARTNDILQYGSEKDEECAKSDFSYAENYQVRLKRKIPDYMSVFTHRHISTNKIYNVGEVLGLRNYILQ